MEIDNLNKLDEYFDYDIIMQRMLNKVPSQIDKREGSIIYDALAPAAAEIAQMYILLKNNIDLVFADTAVDEYLDRLANQAGLTRSKATFAIKKALFYDAENNLIDINLGERFTIGELTYKAIEKMETGTYKMECEQPGMTGNNAEGEMIPINYIQNLAKAELTDILIPGEDQEDDESLRSRYYETISNQSFAGNIADYRKKTKEISGVGAVKVIPVWAGGGTVKLTILDSTYNKASTTLIKKVQEEIAPDSLDKGMGLAPIGHEVTVTTVSEKDISFSAIILYKEGFEESVIKEKIIAAIEEYFNSLKENWENEENVIIRLSKIEARILGIESIIDIQKSKLNGESNNITLGKEEIPKLKEVTINET